VIESRVLDLGRRKKGEVGLTVSNIFSEKLIVKSEKLLVIGVLGA